MALLHLLVLCAAAYQSFGQIPVPALSALSAAAPVFNPVSLPGVFSQISGKGHELWGVTDLNNVVRWSGSAWNPTGITGSFVAAGADGQALVVPNSLSGKYYFNRFDPLNNAWSVVSTDWGTDGLLGGLRPNLGLGNALGWGALSGVYPGPGFGVGYPLGFGHLGLGLHGLGLGQSLVGLGGAGLSGLGGAGLVGLGGAGLSGLGGAGLVGPGGVVIRNPGLVGALGLPVNGLSYHIHDFDGPDDLGYHIASLGHHIHSVGYPVNGLGVVVGPNNCLYKYSAIVSAFDLFPGDCNVYQAAVGDGDELWKIDQAYQVYRYGVGGWLPHALPNFIGRPVHIDVQGPNRVILVDDASKLFFYNGLNWAGVPNAQCVQATVNLDGIYCINRGGGLVQFLG